MQLDHEQFQGAQELAAISIKIAAGTAALTQLKTDEEAYIEEREAKLVARLKQALVDSNDLINAIGANHDALVGYRNELGDFHQKILSLIEGIKACAGRLNNASEVLEQEVTEHEANAKALKHDTLVIAAKIADERAELATWRDKLGDDQRKFDDRTAMLDRTITRIKPN